MIAVCDAIAICDVVNAVVTAASREQKKKKNGVVKGRLKK